MNTRNTLILLLRRLLDPLQIRIVRLAPTRVRGLDPVTDLAFLLHAQRDPIVFDVGANDGEMLQDFLHVFPAARVVAFEPYVPCCEILERKFRDRPNVSIQNVALGAERGTSRLNLYSGNRMNSLLRFDDDPGNVMVKSFALTGTAEVRVETLDAFCAESDIASIDILKIDTQGFDLQVLKGAAKLLEARRIKTVLLEVNFVPMYERQASFPELHQLLTGAGYQFVDFYNQRRNEGYTAWCDACYVAPGPTGPGDRS
jgi:FkbM family methyltransferase